MPELTPIELQVRATLTPSAQGLATIEVSTEVPCDFEALGSKAILAPRVDLDSACKALTSAINGAVKALHQEHPKEVLTINVQVQPKESTDAQGA